MLICTLDNALKVFGSGVVVGISIPFILAWLMIKFGDNP